MWQSMAQLQFIDWSNDVNSTLQPLRFSMLAGLSPHTIAKRCLYLVTSDITNPFCDVTRNRFCLTDSLVVPITLATIGGDGIN
jgi:hypothetical protein